MSLPVVRDEHMRDNLRPLDPAGETDPRRSAASYAGSGRFVLRRVHLSEWLVGIGGVAVFAGMSMSWSAGSSGFESLSLLKLLALIVGAAAIPLPVVVSLSSKTDLPIAWETLLAVAVTLLLLPLLVRWSLPPEAGLEQGFFTVFAASVLMMLACWRSVAREY